MVYLFFLLCPLFLNTFLQAHETVELLIPQAIIETLKKSYSQAELDLINLDLKNIRETCFWGKIPAATRPVYLATAGGPGACKSTILETYLTKTSNFFYMDPDMRSLRYMVNTYYQSLSGYEMGKYPAYVDLLRKAYAQWRDASNYIANTLINEAAEGSYSIAHGTTSTSSSIDTLYKKLIKRNYKIILLLCYAPDSARAEASENRAKVQVFAQADATDIITKGKMFPERFPLYFEYADEIHLYWTNHFSCGSTHAATYEKNKALVVHNQEALDCFIKKYDTDRTGSGLPALQEFMQIKKLG